MKHGPAGSTESIVRALRAQGRSPADTILNALSDRLALKSASRRSAQRAGSRIDDGATAPRPLWTEMAGLPGERA